LFWPAWKRSFATFLPSPRPTFLQIEIHFFSLQAYRTTDFFNLYTCGTTSAVGLQTDIFKSHSKAKSISDRLSLATDHCSLISDP
jgi:hypothetical protein